MNERTSYEAGASPAILERSQNKWRGKNLTRSWVLSPTPRSEKEMEMITSWTPLKSCHWTAFKRKKKRTIYWASCTRGSFTTQKSIAELHRIRTFKFLLQTQWKVSASTTEERKTFHNWFRRRELNFYTWSRLFSFWLQHCLFFCHARMSFRHMTSFAY